MIVTEMRSAHVPVKILGLEIKCEDIGEYSVHSARDIPRRTRFQVRWSDQWTQLSSFKILCSRCLHDSRSFPVPLDFSYCYRSEWAARSGMAFTIRAALLYATLTTPDVASSLADLSAS